MGDMRKGLANKLYPGKKFYKKNPSLTPPPPHPSSVYQTPWS
jgi:hypothetical protein